MDQTKGWNIAQFALSCVHFASLGVLWRQPYLAYKDGGAYWIAYTVCLVVLFMPMVYMQLRLGAVVKKGIVGIIGRYIPCLKGLGIATLLQTGIVMIYYAPLVAYFSYYTIVSMQKEYPWASCNNEWNTASCKNNTYYSDGPPENGSPSVEYYYRKFLETSGGLDGNGLGGIAVYPAVCLLIVWIITFLLAVGGPYVFGWVLYVLAPLQIVLVFVFMIYGYSFLDIDGAQFSLETTFYYLNLSKLSDTSVWISAVTTVLYGTEVYAGMLPTLAKFTGIGSKIRGTPYILWIFVFLFELIIPHIVCVALNPYVIAYVHKAQRGYSSLSSGPNFPFNMVADYFAKLDISPVIAALFYFTWFLFGLHSLVTMLMVVVDNIMEAFTGMRRSWLWRLIITLVLSVFCLLMGLVYATRGGLHFLNMVDLSVYWFQFLYVAIFTTAVVASFLLTKFHIAEKVVLSLFVCIASCSITGLLSYAFSYNSLEEDAYPCAGESWCFPLRVLIGIAPLIIGFIVGFIHAIVVNRGGKMQHVFCGYSDLARESEENQYPVAYTTPGYNVLHVTNPGVMQPQTAMQQPSEKQNLVSANQAFENTQL